MEGINNEVLQIPWVKVAASVIFVGGLVCLAYLRLRALARKYANEDRQGMFDEWSRLSERVAKEWRTKAEEIRKAFEDFKEVHYQKRLEWEDMHHRLTQEVKTAKEHHELCEKKHQDQAALLEDLQRQINSLKGGFTP